MPTRRHLIDRSTVIIAGSTSFLWTPTLTASPRRTDDLSGKFPIFPEGRLDNQCGMQARGTADREQADSGFRGLLGRGLVHDGCWVVLSSKGVADLCHSTTVDRSLLDSSWRMGFGTRDAFYVALCTSLEGVHVARMRRYMEVSLMV